LKESPTYNPTATLKTMSPSNQHDTSIKAPTTSSWKDAATAGVLAFPQVTAGLALRTGLGLTLALYLLNQSHLLPKPIASIVSRFLFYPTLPITVSKRIGKWVTPIDDTLVLGGAPFGLLGYPRKLRDDYGVYGVINMCKEWRGPTSQYQKLGMEELYLPTVDHFEPSEEDLLSALAFLQRHQAQNKKVYVHCRAGHGRSGAIAYAWLLLQGYPKSLEQPEEVNAKLRKLRDVRKGLWKQPNLTKLKDRLKRSRGKLVEASDEFFQNQESSTDDDSNAKKEL